MVGGGGGRAAISEKNFIRIASFIDSSSFPHYSRLSDCRVVASNDICNSILDQFTVSPSLDMVWLNVCRSVLLRKTTCSDAFCRAISFVLLARKNVQWSVRNVRRRPATLPQLQRAIEWVTWESSFFSSFLSRTIRGKLRSSLLGSVSTQQTFSDMDDKKKCPLARK